MVTIDCQQPDEILLSTSACRASARAWIGALCVNRVRVGVRAPDARVRGSLLLGSDVWPTRGIRGEQASISGGPVPLTSHKCM